MTPSPAAVIVLAAGAGTRMKSKLAKVLHPLGSRTLLGHALAAAQGVHPQRLCVVVRHQRERVAAHVRAIAPAALIADQDAIPGTGRAVQCGLQALDEDAVLTGTVLVTSGDVPLLQSETLAQLAAHHARAGAAVTVLTTRVSDPTGYGRIVRTPAGALAQIVEHRDADPAQLRIDEVNAGIYAFDAGFLRSALTGLGRANAQGEVYLTDTIALAHQRGLVAQAWLLADSWQAAGCNDRVQLAQLHAEMNRRIVYAHMRAGVTVCDPRTTWIDPQVRIGQDATILPCTHLHGYTVIGADARVGPFTSLHDVKVAPGATVRRADLADCEVPASS